MMSLSKIKFSKTVNNLYRFKLKTNMNLFNSLIVLHLFGILFSLGGIGQQGGEYYNISYYTADYMIGLTMVWAFIIGLQFMSRDLRNHDFLFVTNRLASHIANGLFLFTMSVIGAITAILTRYLSKLIIHFSFGTVYMNEIVPPTITEYIFGVIATILFVFIFSIIGYMVGSIIQLNKIFIILLPVFIITYLILSARSGQSNLLIILFEFYFAESSFILYLLKVMGTSAIIFTSAIGLTNRLEAKT